MAVGEEVIDGTFDRIVVGGQSGLERCWVYVGEHCAETFHGCWSAGKVGDSGFKWYRKMLRKVAVSGRKNKKKIEVDGEPRMMGSHGMM